MSYYYKHNFISPEPIYSLIKEELKSYMDTGAIDDLLFPKWTTKCLDKLGRLTTSIQETFLEVCDFTSRLPENFSAVREAWMIADLPMGFPFRTANSVYTQTSLKIEDAQFPTDSCQQDCSPQVIQGVYKTNSSANFSFKKLYLLRPGNISVRKDMSFDCVNIGSSSADTFDIRDNKFVTNFREGNIYLLFYQEEVGEEGYQLIPDNYRIKEYIEAFIKYKCFESLSNSIVDETYKQIAEKKAEYKSMSDEAFIMAKLEIQKQDVYKKVRRMKNVMDRFNKFEIPNHTYNGWRR